MDYASRWPSTARLSRTLGFYKSNSEARAVLQGFSALRPCRTGTSSETDAEGFDCRRSFSRMGTRRTAKGVDMDEFIEATAQLKADALDITREKAVSPMTTLLPHLKRWSDEGER